MGVKRFIFQTDIHRNNKRNMTTKTIQNIRFTLREDNKVLIEYSTPSAELLLAVPCTEELFNDNLFLLDRLHSNIVKLQYEIKNIKA